MATSSHHCYSALQLSSCVRCSCLTTLEGSAVVFQGKLYTARLCPVGMLGVICRRMPGTQIVAMGVLPKGQTWPNTCTEAITHANGRLQEYAERHKPWLTYVDVGDRFLTHQVCPISRSPATDAKSSLLRTWQITPAGLPMQCRSSCLFTNTSCRSPRSGPGCPLSLCQVLSADAQTGMACRMMGRGTRRLCRLC